MKTKIMGFYQGTVWQELHLFPKGYIYQDCMDTKAYFVSMVDALDFYHARLKNN